MSSLKDTRKRITKLEAEKAKLLLELETLKKEAEKHAESLEEEVEQLKIEKESLKKLLDSL